MGWFNRDKSPQRSVITDETREAREQVEFEKVRAMFHDLCALDLSDVTPFVDEIVNDINRQYLDNGTVSGTILRFPDILQPVVPLIGFRKAFYPLVLRAVPETSPDGLTMMNHGPKGFHLHVRFPEISHHGIAEERIAQ